MKKNIFLIITAILYITCCIHFPEIEPVVNLINFILLIMSFPVVVLIIIRKLTHEEKTHYTHN